MVLTCKPKKKVCFLEKNCSNNCIDANVGGVQAKFLRSNYFTEWIFTFLPTFQTISKKWWVKTKNPFHFPSFLLITFPKKTLLPQIFLETVLKFGKKVQIHFFENVVFEKKNACTKYVTNTNKLFDKDSSETKICLRMWILNFQY